MDDLSGSGAAQPDHFRFWFDPEETLAAVALHRRRFASGVAGLDAEQLRAASRCTGWSVADVLRHGIWADDAMRGLWSGDREVLKGFDPRTTPDEAVEAGRTTDDLEVRRRYLASTEAMVAELESADGRRFGEPSLSPAGTVPWWLSALHLGWDTTIHERDVMSSLGRAVEVESHESEPVLAYTLVLNSFFCAPGDWSVSLGAVRFRRCGGRAAVWTSQHRDGAVVLHGDPVAVVDAMSGRAPLSGAVRGDRATVQRLGGLARFFAST